MIVKYFCYDDKFEWMLSFFVTMDVLMLIWRVFLEILNPIYEYDFNTVESWQWIICLTLWDGMVVRLRHSYNVQP